LCHIHFSLKEIWSYLQQCYCNRYFGTSFTVAVRYRLCAVQVQYR
jgi:hypothetical protein